MELYRTSYYSKEIEDSINNLVGKPFGFLQRLKMGGIGSQRFLVEDANIELLEVINQHNSTPYVNIELRPKGILLMIKLRLDTWSLALPYYQLNIFKNKSDLGLYCGVWKIKLLPYHNMQLDRKFIAKLMDHRSRYNTGASAIDPLQ